MAATSNRKHFFILGFFLLLALIVAVLILRDIPAPVSEQVIELDSQKILK